MRKKILLAVDLDHTHFFSHKPGVQWIGSKKFWVDLYAEISTMVSSQGVQLIFAIVTVRGRVDEIVEAAVRAFRPFLEKDNPHMFISKDNEERFLCNVPLGLIYHTLNSASINKERLDPPMGAVSHVEFAMYVKSPSILRVADFHNIPRKYALMLDDNASILREVRAAGIQAVSCECFHYQKQNENNDRLDDEVYVNENLLRIKKELISKVQAILLEMLSAQENLGSQLTSGIGFFEDAVRKRHVKNIETNYAILGIPEGASQKQIRLAYHNLLRQHSLSERKDTEKFMEISRAFNSLVNLDDSDDEELGCCSQLANGFRKIFKF